MQLYRGGCPAFRVDLDMFRESQILLRLVRGRIPTLPPAYHVPMKRFSVSVGLLISGAGAGLLVAFLAAQGLERASWWASVIVLFLTVAAVVTGIWSAWASMAARNPTASAAGSASSESTGRTRRVQWLGKSGSLRQKGSKNIANTGIMDHVENEKEV